MDKIKFEYLAKKVLANNLEHNNIVIGQRQEKNIHKFLKHYLSTDINTHEIKIKRYYADVMIGNRIFEIQSKQFFKLKNKLDYYLPLYDVTIVYPIIRQKTIIKIDVLTGELISSRKSPKKNSILSFFDELYGIKSYLECSNLTYKVLLFDADEIRYIDKELTNLKKVNRRLKDYINTTIIPTTLLEEIDVNTSKDLIKFIPDKLPFNFSTNEITAVGNIQKNTAIKVANILHSVKIFKKVNKKGNLIIYNTIDKKYD